MAKLPANAATGANRADSISAISCASPGNCTAVGSYRLRPASLEHWAGLLLTEKAGHWAAGVEAASAGLSAVSCASAGNCTAVSGFGGAGDIYTEGGIPGMLLTEKDGRWAPGVEGEGANLVSVSCASPGNCTAVGGRLLFTQKDGRWAKGVEAPLPSDADTGREVELTSVSCSSDGRCSAVGIYNINYGRSAEAGEGVLLTKRAGKWRAAKAVMPPDGPGEGVILASVSCASGGNCGAIGFYNINIDSGSGVEGVLLTEKAGKWLPGVRAMPPKNVSSGYWENYVGLGGISCSAPGACVAVGSYRGGSGLTLLTEQAGTWQRGVEVALPPGQDREDLAISCAAPRSCTVVGDYYDGGQSHDFLLTEVAGHWTRKMRTSYNDAYDSVFSVSCSAPGICGAIGRNKPTFGGYSGSGVLFDSTTMPCVVPMVTGKILAAARRTIESHACSVGRIKHTWSRTIEAGRVISQTRQPGRHRAPWTRVGLRVSSGP
jgi:hypothetical protein